jgi:hypothetical protein
MFVPVSSAASGNPVSEAMLRRHHIAACIRDTRACLEARQQSLGNVRLWASDRAKAEQLRLLLVYLNNY